MEILDLEDFAHCPSPRYGHTATLISNTIYVFGGVQSDYADSGPSATSAPEFYGSLHKFDVSSMTWDEQVFNDDVSGFGRHFHTSVHNPDDGCLYIFAGKSNGYRNDIIRFDLTSGVFSKVQVVESTKGSESPSPRWGHSATLRPSSSSSGRSSENRSMLIFGGYDSNGFVHNTLHEFVFRTLTWRRIDIVGLKSIPRRYLHSACLVQLRSQMGSSIWQYVLFGGLKKDGTVLEDIWSIEIPSDSPDEYRIRDVQVEVDETVPDSVVLTQRTYGQRSFVMNGKVYSYGGRSTPDLDVQQCVVLDLDLRENSDKIHGVVSQVDFPFSKEVDCDGPALVHGSVTVAEGEKLLFFGGQKRERETTPVSAVVSLPRDDQVVFENEAANLLHFCPDDVLLIMLSYLDRVSLCSVRAVSSLWSPSVLSVHDRVWGSIFESVSEGTTLNEKAHRDLAVEGQSMKAKTQVVMRLLRDVFGQVEACYCGKNELDLAQLCVAFQDRAVIPEYNDYTGDFKCVVIGDGATGKTCLLISTLTGRFPDDYVPTVFDVSCHSIKFGRTDPKISFWDTAGEEDYDRLRPLSYPGCHMFICCFSCCDPTSLENVKTKWYPEKEEHMHEALFCLCATKIDLRGDDMILARLQGRGETFVTPKQGLRVAKQIHADFYIETSAKDGTNLKKLLSVCCAGGMLKEFPNFGIRRRRPRCGIM